MITTLQTYIILLASLALSFSVAGQERPDITLPDSLEVNSSDTSFQKAFFKALAERGIENYDKAIEILSEIDSDTEPVVFFQLGLNYYDLEDYRSALINFEKANSLKPNDYHVKEAIFKVYEQQKDYSQAIKSAQTLAPQNAEYYEILANLYLIVEEYPNALNALDKAEEIQGFDAHKDKLREVIFEAYNTPEVAVEYYKNRIKQEPYNPLNDLRLIQFLMSKQNYDKAIMFSKKALKNHPLFTRYYVQQTKIYIALNQYELASEALKKVVTDRFLEEKYKVEAINYYKSFVEKHPEAENVFIQILNLATKSAEDNSSFLDLGLFYFETDKVKSLENFKKAKHQNPQDFQILKYISVLHYQLNQYNEAISSADEALEIYPTQAIFMLVKGRSLVEQAQYNKAKSVLLEALSYVFEENEMMQKLYESLSRSYKGLNELSQAKNYMDKANALSSKLK